MDDDGVVTARLDEESFRSAVERLLDGGARLLVVAFQGAGLNPANELRARELFEAMLPTFYLGRPFLLLSHQVSPSGTDAERLNSAVISGYLHRELVGYLYRLEPMDLHAWFEAYVGGRWYTFDATQAKLKGGYVAVGYGRDAADVAIYNQFGPAIYPTTQTVGVECISG